MRLLRQLQAAFAAFLAICVLALGFAAVSPQLHRLICSEESHHQHSDVRHHGHASDSDIANAFHECAVQLFGHGCTASAPVIFVSPVVLNATSVAQFTEFMLTRTLRGPARVCGAPSFFV